jgi:hypothetical protein
MEPGGIFKFGEALTDLISEHILGVASVPLCNESKEQVSVFGPGFLRERGSMLD